MINQITKALCEKYQKFHQDGEKEYLLTIVVNQLCKSLLQNDLKFPTDNSNIEVIDKTVTVDGWRLIVSNNQKELFRIVIR